MTQGPPSFGLLLGSERLAPVALGIIIISECVISLDGVLLFQPKALAGLEPYCRAHGSLDAA